MAHFARLDENNIVIDRLLISNDACNGGDDESAGKQMIADSGFEGRWVRCSFNTVKNTHRFDGIPFRGSYPQIGWVYDETLDKFIPAKPGDNFEFNEESYVWEEVTND